MPERTYTLDFVTPNAAATTQDVLALTAAVERLDAAVTAARKNLAGLNRTLGSASAAAKSAGAAAQGMGTQLGAAVPAARSLEGGLRSAARAKRDAAAAAKAFNAETARIQSNLSRAVHLNERLAQSFLGVGESSASATAALARFLSAAAGLRAVSAVGEAFSKAMQDAKSFALEAAERVLKLRDSVRELRKVMGDKTTTGEATKAVVDLMNASGASLEQATEFNTLWESTVPAARKKLGPDGKPMLGLNDKQVRDAKVEALRFAVANGMDPKTVGEVLPLIAVGEQINSTDQLLGKFGTMSKLAVEGVGEFDPLMKVYQRLRGTMVREKGGGAAKSSEELMAIIGSASVESGGESAATREIDQAWRDLSVANTAKKKATFAKFGIKGDDDFVTRIEKIAPLIEQAEASGQSVPDVMAAAGFGNAFANSKIAKFVANKGLLRTNVEMSKGMAGGAAVRAENAAFAAENPDRFARAAVETSVLNVGEKTHTFATLRRFAEAGARNRGGIDTALTNFGEGLIDLPGNVPLVGGLLGAGQEPAREKVLDAIISGHILKTVPNAARRFPDLTPGISLNPTATPARGTRVNSILNELSPEERAAVTESLKTFAAEAPAGQNPAAAGAAKAGAGGVGPQAALGGAGGAGESPVQREILGTLKAIERNQTRGATGGAAVASVSLPGDGGDVGPMRS